MKTKQLLSVLTILVSLLFPSLSRAADIAATGSGNWSSTVPDAPWPGGIVPSTNDSVEVDSPYTVLVDTNVTVAYIYSVFGDTAGTVTLAPGTTLTVVGDTAGAFETQTLAVLNATAPGCTVVYTGNCFWAKRTDYYNLVMSNSTATSSDFYNGGIPGYDATAMHIYGDMTIVGSNKVQQGADVLVDGNLILGTNSSWDASSFKLIVKSNTFVAGLLLDGDGALGTNYFMGNMTINPSTKGGWNVSDVTQWAVGGNLTNNGRIAGGLGYGSISFNGTGVITGTAFKIPTITINGTYTIGTTITLTTNTPTLKGTMVFDLANTNQLILQSLGTNFATLYYDGGLKIVNSGATPAPGKKYTLFNAIAYDGTFVSTNFPALPAGLSWVDNTRTDGSISVVGSALGSPKLNLTAAGTALQLSWDSTTYPGYVVLAQTNGLGGTWKAAGSTSVSPFNTTINPANPAVFYRLYHP